MIVASVDAMYRGHAVGVVVPAYNESSTVGAVLSGIPGYVDRVYAVDDGSTDGTWTEILRTTDPDADRCERSELGSPPRVTDGGSLPDRVAESATDGRIVPLRHERNRGVGAAIKTGYLAALNDTVDVVATVDADGQMDLSELPRLLDPIVEDRAEYTKGNRLATAEDRTGMPAFRLFGNLVLSGLTRVVSGYWHVTDSQNGYTAVTAETLRRIDVESLAEHYGYCNDLLVKLNTVDARVLDVPMPAIYGDETSHIDYGTYVCTVSWTLLRNFWWRLRRTADRSVERTRGSQSR